MMNKRAAYGNRTMKRYVAIALAIVVAASAYYAAQPRVEILDVPAANNRLAIDFYKQVSNGTENIFFSPPAIYATLAALYEGADGEAAAQIQRLLSLETDREKRHAVISQFLSDIYRHDPYVRPEMAGVLWLPDGADANDSYQSTAKSYGLDVRSGISEDVIDGWAAYETNGRITDVVGSEDIGGGAVITNVADFEGEWYYQFSEDGDRQLFDIGVDYVIIPSLQQRQFYEVAHSGDVVMIKFPYRGERLTMFTIDPWSGSRPASGSIVQQPRDLNPFDPHSEFKLFEESLTVEMIEQWKTNLYTADRDINIPKFEIKSNYDLKEPLSNLGVTNIFDSDANLIGINGNHNLYLSKIFQKSFIKITASGTDDLSTGSPNSFTGAIPEGPSFTLGGPFIFIIQDEKTGAILFMGRVIDPTA